MVEFPIWLKFSYFYVFKYSVIDATSFTALAVNIVANSGRRACVTSSDKYRYSGMHFLAPDTEAGRKISGGARRPLSA
jgi:hypothetical protein